MSCLYDIINDMKEDIDGMYVGSKQITARISSLQTSEQFIKEMQAIPAEKLPAVIIVFDGANYNPQEICLETRLSLVVVDRFRANSDERAMSLFEVVDYLMDNFPALGKKHGITFVYPTDIQLASVDPAFSAIALGFMIKQRSQ